VFTKDYSNWLVFDRIIQKIKDRNFYDVTSSCTVNCEDFKLLSKSLLFNLFMFVMYLACQIKNQMQAVLVILTK